jgi:hypothetical protein
MWEPHGTKNDRDLAIIDADFVAGLLHARLSSAAKLRQVGSITAARKAPTTKGVNVAIVGVGALGGGHRLKQHENLDDVKTVSDLLMQLNSLSQEIEREFARASRHVWHPIGDVCNWYFVVDDASQCNSKTQLALLTRLVSALNKKFVNTTANQLAEIAERGPVIAIAGGRHKLAALRHALNQGSKKPWLTHIVTDKETAIELTVPHGRVSWGEPPSDGFEI